MEIEKKYCKTYQYKMVMKSEMKLLGTPASPFVNRVQFALNLKSIEYEFIEENLACKSELLLKSNPVHEKVPVLFHGDNPPICESRIILEYLDEIRPDGPPILPTDPLDRAAARFWAAYMDDEFFWFFEDLRRTSGKDAKQAIETKILQRMEVLEGAFVKCSKGKDYFGGDSIGYLDIVFGCFLGWMKFAQDAYASDMKLLDEKKTPGLLGWSERFTSHEAIKKDIPAHETLVKFHMMLHVAKPPFPEN